MYFNYRFYGKYSADLLCFRKSTLSIYCLNFPEPIAQYPVDNRVEIQPRPSQLPMREFSKSLDLSESYLQASLDDDVAEQLIGRNGTDY
uniref:Uncharacterized protein n=1 Tax=Caenorhabditis japonica TaxID=281687 RepID=A0A8R1IVN5_CAEJA